MTSPDDVKSPTERAAALGVRLLDVVGDAFADFNNECPEDCRFLRLWKERHPYGMGYATETLCDCEAATEADAEDCPLLLAQLARAEDGAPA